MAREAMAKIRAERDAALASLDETARDAAVTVAASTAQLLAYVNEQQELDEQIAALRKRRGEVYVLRENHSKAHAKTKQESYAKVAELLNRGQVPPNRRLAIVTELVYGPDNLALPTALREGRRYLATLDDMPFVCLGYVRLTSSMWCGGRTLGGAQVELLGNVFCIAIPVAVNGRTDTLNVRIDDLARANGTGYTCDTQAYIGEDDIVANVRARLKGFDPKSHEFEQARQALTDAGFTAARIDDIFAHVND